jgi:hypothetical protein
MSDLIPLAEVFSAGKSLTLGKSRFLEEQGND